MGAKLVPAAPGQPSGKGTRPSVPATAGLAGMHGHGKETRGYRRSTDGNWKYSPRYSWLTNTLLGGCDGTVVEKPISYSQHCFEASFFISNFYCIALIVSLSSLPLLFYPFILLSVLCALFFSTLISIPIVLTSPFFSWFFPNGNPKPSESSLKTNTIMMGDNMIITAVMITFVDWMLHRSLPPAVTKMVKEPLSQDNE